MVVVATTEIANAILSRIFEDDEAIIPYYLQYESQLPRASKSRQYPGPKPFKSVNKPPDHWLPAPILVAKQPPTHQFVAHDHA